MNTKPRSQNGWQPMGQKRIPCSFATEETRFQISMGPAPEEVRVPGNFTTRRLFSSSLTGRGVWLPVT
jgi:hypothetical protein